MTKVKSRSTSLADGEYYRFVPFGNDGEEERHKFRVPTSRATEDVTINGSVLNALMGIPAKTCACALSLFCRDNASVFSHPVYMAYVFKSSVLIVDRVYVRKNADGTVTEPPDHCVHYHHRYPWLIELQDRNRIKALLDKNPLLIERTFTLKPPRDRTGYKRPNPSRHGNIVGPTPKLYLQGAKERAATANFIKPLIKMPTYAREAAEGK